MAISGEKYGTLRESDEYRKQLSTNFKNRWQDPSQRKILLENSNKAKQTQNYRNKVSENNKKRWSNPKKREQLINSLRKTKGTKECREGQSKRSQKLANDPQYIEKLKSRVKASWEKEGEKKRRSEIMKLSYQNNPELIEKKKMKKWWTNGTISTYSEICPPGFRRGRIIVRKNKNQS
jgi:hypothetical protein